MDRRGFALATLAVVLGPRASHAQPIKKVARIGYLSMASPERDRHWVTALRDGLRDLGYVEGQNLILEQRHAANDVAKALALAEDLVRRDIAVMLVYASPTMPTLKKLISNVPIVFLGHADPVGSGAAVSRSRIAATASSTSRSVSGRGMRARASTAKSQATFRLRHSML